MIKRDYTSFAPGGTIVVIGIPVEKISFDITPLSVKEAKIETVFRYSNQYEKAIQMLATNKIDVKPLMTDTIPFKESVGAFKKASEHRPNDVKLQINNIY